MTTEKNERMQFDVTFMSKARNNLALSTEKPYTRSRPLRAAYLGTGYWFSDDDGETHQMQIGVCNAGGAQLLRSTTQLGRLTLRCGIEVASLLACYKT